MFLIDFDEATTYLTVLTRG